MNTPNKDPLLMAGRIMTIIARIALVIGMIGVGIGLAGLAVIALGWMPDDVTQHITVETGGEFSTDNLWVLLLPLATAMIALGLSFDFVTRLAQIIDTVGEGAPFTLANALRLTRMAWLALAIQAVSLVASILGDWAEQRFEGQDVEFTSEFSLTGIALAVVLFILARVFREGARMRDELEGTV